jgi:hypothetical protein
MDGSPKGAGIEFSNHPEMIPGGKSIKQIVINPVRHENPASPDRQQLPDLKKSSHKNLSGSTHFISNNGYNPLRLTPINPFKSMDALKTLG